jgi:hypothetical protein
MTKEQFRQSLKELFTKFPYYLATYVFLVGIIWLLFFPFKPVKLDPPLHITPNAQGEALLLAHTSNGQVFKVSYTGSMKPLLQGGEWAVTVAAYDKIQLGQVLVYKAPYNQSPIIHRAVQKDKDGWLMSGDSSPISESWFRVTPESYIGTAIAIFRDPKNTP